MEAYRALVYETPGFTDYFFEATPIREIAELNIGSRPAIAQGVAEASRTCAPSPGASAGASAAWRCRAGTASGRRSRPFLNAATDAAQRRPAWHCCRRCTASGPSSARC
jgi:hypothetical protein